ncbi:permease [Marinobacterium nitratireducens]|uniref:Permease n=1 Tax=Marinobacterium nitratireducens TaxID=518897 RepID=A0A918DUM2_9GAMM|nr:DMT family transporter [Marinobacterium nitratireducens]GGO83143.1 permease [Marinobacterium nitratireducens]
MITKSLQADLLMLLVTLLAAMGWMFSHEALQSLPPMGFMGVRFLLAGLLVSSVGWPQLKRLKPGAWRRAAGTGVVMGAAMLCWILGLFHATHLGVGAFISSLGVVLVPVVGWLFFRQNPSASTWVALLVAALGMACLSLEGGFHFSPSDIFFAAAALTFAVHFNLNSRFAISIPPVALTGVQLSVVGVIALLASSLFETWQQAPGWSGLGWVAASVLIATSLRFFLQIKAQSMASASHAAIILTLEPVWTAILAMFWLDERMSALQGVGCSLIFLALLINRWRWLLQRPKQVA